VPPFPYQSFPGVGCGFDEGIREFPKSIKYNPARLARRKGVGSNEAGNEEKEGQEVNPEHVYNLEELNRLLAATTPGGYQALIMAVAFTGMRHGEALGLQWGDIDFESEKVLIRRNRPDIYRDGEPVFYIPKTKNAVREIPIPSELVAVLKQWKLPCPASKWDLVFPKADGRPQDRKTVLRGGLYPAVRRAGVKKLDMHALRHTFASILLSRRTPVTEVSAYLGHANPQITMTIYAHWLPKTKTDSISRLASAVFAARQTPVQEGVGHHKDISTVESVG